MTATDSGLVRTWNHSLHGSTPVTKRKKRKQIAVPPQGAHGASNILQAPHPPTDRLTQAKKKTTRKTRVAYGSKQYPMERKASNTHTSAAPHPPNRRAPKQKEQ